MPIIAVDPSISSLGCALVSFEGIPLNAWFIHQRTARSHDYHRRAFAMAWLLRTLIESIGDEQKEVAEVVIETPVNWFTPRAIRSKDSEAVQRLYYCVGAIAGLAATAANVSSIWGVGPKWKGQTPKDIMLRRAYKYLQDHEKSFTAEYMPHDVAEALLLGRYAAAHRLVGGQGQGYSDPIEGIHDRTSLDTSLHFDIEEYV